MALIAKCPGCAKSYPVPGNLLPEHGLRVRCPSCGKLFRLRLSRPPPADDTEKRQELTSPQPSAASPGVPEEEKAASREPRPEREEESWITERRARRYARALALELIQGQRARRDRALADGSLVLEFADELRAAWEKYQRKIGADLARRTPFFREALNEIFADGKPVF